MEVECCTRHYRTLLRWMLHPPGPEPPSNTHMQEDQHSLLWVVDFPMFEWNEEEGRLEVGGRRQRWPRGAGQMRGAAECRGAGVLHFRVALGLQDAYAGPDCSTLAPGRPCTTPSLRRGLRTWRQGTSSQRGEPHCPQVPAPARNLTWCSLAGVLEARSHPFAHAARWLTTLCTMGLRLAVAAYESTGGTGL